MSSCAMCETLENTRMNVVSSKDVQGLLEYFSKNTYKAKDTDAVTTEAVQKCVELMKADYNVSTISNTSGELCGQYPSQLVILENENAHNSSGTGRLNSLTDTIYESPYDCQKLRDLFNKARNARCRARFPIPVILFKGKHICRSATLSGGPEIYGRSGYDYLFSSSEATENIETEESSGPATQSDWQLFDRVRSNDIKLLKTLNVGTIVDFMVEKKKVKFGVNVTSSEKVDKENRYADFKLISLPYPGCEFFKDYRDHNYTAEGLIFDWGQAHVDADISVPEDPILVNLHIEWENYKNWDLVEITQNYMRLLLKYIQESNSGILIHCISGWDRTPLFISLLRLSLWADGLAHQALDAQQILYLTIAYDWMLFGHHLPDRLSKGEEIFFFCFSMLKHLVPDEFSIVPNRHKAQKVERTTEKTVIRTDSDSQLDAVMLEHDPRGSNISLNSSCSSVSSKSQEQLLPMWFQAISHDSYVLDNFLTGIPVNKELTRSPQARRTSPVTVPVTTRLRSRQESSPSLSTGSWQMITGTGSLRGSDSTSDSNGIQNECGSSQDSSHTLVDEDTVLTYNPDGPPNRKKRLLKVRELFYHNYSMSVGFSYNEGSDSSLGAILGNIAEKVGLTAART